MRPASPSPKPGGRPSMGSSAEAGAEVTALIYRCARPDLRDERASTLVTPSPCPDNPARPDGRGDTGWGYCPAGLPICFFAAAQARRPPPLPSPQGGGGRERLRLYFSSPVSL